MRRHILYIGWVGFGNLGDDGCRDLFINKITQEAKKNGELSLDVTSQYPAHFDEWHLLRLNPDLIVLGAGSLLEPIYLKPVIAAQQRDIPTVVWGSGHDGLPEETIHDLENNKPLDPLLFNPDSTYAIRHMVNKATYVGIRGPYTENFLRAIGCNHPMMHICGDPGLLLSDTEETPSSDICNLLDTNKPLIPVNWGTAFNQVYGGDEGKATEQLAEVLRCLSGEFKFIIYPLWEKDLPSCQNLVQQKVSAEVSLLNRVPTMAELAFLFSKSMLTINLKLHANVFSAALGCPFISLAYRSKCFDFAQSMGCPEIAIALSSENLKAQLLDKVAYLKKHRNHYARKIERKRDQYRQSLTTLTENIFILAQDS